MTTIIIIMVIIIIIIIITCRIFSVSDNPDRIREGSLSAVRRNKDELPSTMPFTVFPRLSKQMSG
jgi:uncharacterized protein YpmB